MLLLALITAAAVAGLKLIHALDGTSFQDPAIYPEFWMLCGIFIAVNCERWQEAALKVFVFFLVSQPLIYLIQVPFVPDGFGIFRYYGYWFKITLLTLPAGAAAFFLQKKNLLSAAMLAGGALLCGYMAARYLWSAVYVFPRHLLSLLFCVALPVFLVRALLDKKSLRLIPVLAMVLTLAVFAYQGKPTRWVTIDPGEGVWTAVVEDESVAVVTTEPDGSIRIHAKGEGNTNVTLTCQNQTGTVAEYAVTVSGGSIMVNEW